MKKILLVVLLILGILIAGCASNTESSQGSNNEDILYVNQNYNFSLSFPKGWGGKFFLTEVEPTWIDVCHVNDLPDERIARLFTLHIFTDNDAFEERNQSFQETISMMKIYEDAEIIVAVTYPSDVAYVHSEQKYLEEYNAMLGDISEILSSIESKLQN